MHGVWYRTMSKTPSAMGPFEVECSAFQSAVSEQSLTRNLDCTNYCTCLNVAVALNWESFTCEGCSGEINQSLKWRAGQSARQDSVSRVLCPRLGIELITRK